MSDLRDNFAEFYEYEYLQFDYCEISRRKSSFVDLLSPVLGIPDDNLIDLHINSISNEWNPPSIVTQASETEPFELHLEEILNIPGCRLKAKKESCTKILPIRHFEHSSSITVGTITADQRRAKIAKYLEKRKKRTWKKRIYYDCRRKVA